MSMGDYIPQQIKFTTAIFNPNGDPLKQASAYQKRHRPDQRIQHKCAGFVADVMCESCGRYLSRNVPHKPNQQYSLGYTHKYADGSHIVYTPTGEKK